MKMTTLITRLLPFAIAACLWPVPAAHAQGWQVSPVRHELTIPPGQSQTFAIRVEREAGNAAEPVRFTATPRDWDLTRAGESVEANAGTLPESATGWMSFTPAVFNLKAGEYAWIRVTISVPKEAAAGVYRAGLFFEEHSAVPQSDAATRRMVLRYRLSTLIYVIVPRVEKSLEVHDLLATDSAAEGLRFTAVLENTGTVHLRPQHWIEVFDPHGKQLLKLEPVPTMVVLPKRQLAVAIQVPKEKLPASSSYTVKYFVDGDRELPLKATTVSLIPQP